MSVIESRSAPTAQGPRWTHENSGRPSKVTIYWTNAIPLTMYHVGALMVFVVGFSWPAAIACFIAYWTMIFGVSAGYHRYFAHRSFKTSRAFQFVLGWLGATSAQMGPLWWTAHHRRHHRFADEKPDSHSPTVWGFLWSHIGWMLEKEHQQIDERYVRDWKRFPEIGMLDRLRYLPPNRFEA